MKNEISYSISIEYSAFFKIYKIIKVDVRFLQFFSAFAPFFGSIKFLVLVLTCDPAEVAESAEEGWTSFEMAGILTDPTFKKMPSDPSLRRLGGWRGRTLEKEQSVKIKWKIKCS